MEGIVIRKTSFEETSLILNVLTSYGISSLMVRGAKRKNSEKLAISEPLTKISYIQSKSEKFPSLIEGSIIDDYQLLKSSLESFTLASIILDYAQSLKDSNIDSKKMYSLVEMSLDEMKEEDPEISLFRFEILLAKELGIAPRKSYLIDEYKATESLINSLENLIKGEEIIDKNELRIFFKKYYAHELNLELKSKKIYIDLFN